MSQYTPVFHHTPSVTTEAWDSAMVSAIEVYQSQLDKLSPLAAEAVQYLLINLPEFSFTVEVDLLGAHRITIHFGGGSIAIDE